MELNDFKRLIEDMDKWQQQRHAAYGLGIDLINWLELPSSIEKQLMIAAFGKEGADWIEWYCFEADFGRRKDMTATDNGKPICYDIESLWETVMESKG